MSNLPVLSDFTGLLPAIHGGAEDGGGLAGVLEGLLDGLTHLTEPGAWSGLFGGIMALGYNIHPMVVHFPIALLTAYLFADFMAMFRKDREWNILASGLLYLGTLGAIAAAAAGLVAEHLVAHGDEVHDIMERHELLGLTVASLSVLLSLIRYLGGSALTTAMGQGLRGFMGLLIWVCLFFGADLGGTMVYQYGVGVQKLQDTAQVQQHEHDGHDAHHEHGTHDEEHEHP